MSDTQPTQHPMDDDERRFGDLLRDLRDLPRVDAPRGFLEDLHARLEAPRRPSWLQSLRAWLESLGARLAVSPRRVPVFALGTVGMVCVAVIGVMLYRSGVMDTDAGSATEGAGSVNGHSTPSYSIEQYRTIPVAPDDAGGRAEGSQRGAAARRGTQAQPGASTPAAAPAGTQHRDGRGAGAPAGAPGGAPGGIEPPAPRMETQRGLPDIEAPAPEVKEAAPAGAADEAATESGRLRNEAKDDLRKGLSDSLRAWKAESILRADSVRRADSLRLAAPRRPQDSARPR